MSNDISIYTPPATEIGDPLWDPAAFAHGQSIATMLAISGLLPKHLTGRDKIAAVHAIVAMAKTRGESPILLAQSSYEIGGKVSVGVPYMIARAINQGIDLDWTIVRGPSPVTVMVRSGNEDRGVKVEDLQVTCTAEIRGKARSVTLTLADATRRGWTKNDAYRHSPELMLRYRTASQWLSLYAPGVKLGLDSDEGYESSDVPAVATVVEQPAPAMPARKTAADIVDAIVVEDSAPPPPPVAVVAEVAKPAPPPKVVHDPAVDADLIRQCGLTGMQPLKAIADAVKAYIPDPITPRRLKSALGHGHGLGWWEWPGGDVPVIFPAPAKPAAIDPAVMAEVTEALAALGLDEVAEVLSVVGISDLDAATADQVTALRAELERMADA